MSIIRDAMELGYGVNHFIVTGENFPSSWEEQEDHYEYSDEEIEAHVNSLDTKEGWLERGLFICCGEDPVGTIEGDSYYSINQTVSLDDFINSHSEIINEIIKDFSQNVPVNSFALDVGLRALKASVIDKIDHMKDTLTKYVEFGENENSNKDNEFYSDDDVPF